MPLVPASIRNKNPGAMEPGPSSKKFGSTSYETLQWTYKGKPAVNKCATFPTSHHGAAAMFDLLQDRGFEGLIVSEVEMEFQNPQDLLMDRLLFDRWRMKRVDS